MLVGEDQDDSEAEFQGNLGDSRFASQIKENKLFALDPTHKNFNKHKLTAQQRFRPKNPNKK